MIAFIYLKGPKPSEKISLEIEKMNNCKQKLTNELKMENKRKTKKY